MHHRIYNPNRLPLTDAQRHEITKYWIGSGVSATVLPTKFIGQVQVEIGSPLRQLVPFRLRELAWKLVTLLAGEQRGVDFYNRFCLDGAGHTMREDGKVAFSNFIDDGMTWCSIADI